MHLCNVEIQCKDPGQGINATREMKTNTTEYGDMVTYRCLPQHVLVGGGLEFYVLRCTSQGTWNGTAPECEGIQIYP